MQAEHSPIDQDMVEDLVRKVRGVLAVRVVQNESRQIDEIHAVGSPDRSAKQMVRDIETILFVRGGVRIDHRKISLVQIAETGLPPALVRVQLVQVAPAADERQPSVTVTLAFGERQVNGLGRARPGRAADPELLTAYATTHALDQLIGALGQLHVENLQRQSFGALDVYLAHLTLSINDGIETLLGISVARDDEQHAVARAVLDAMNRRLQRLLSENKGALRAP